MHLNLSVFGNREKCGSTFIMITVRVKLIATDYHLSGKVTISQRKGGIEILNRIQFFLSMMLYKNAFQGPFSAN